VKLSHTFDEPSEMQQSTPEQKKLVVLIGLFSRMNPVNAAEERIVSLDEFSSARGGVVDTTTEGGAADKSIREFAGQMDHSSLQIIGSEMPELDSEEAIKSSAPVLDLVTEDSNAAG
jgi:hypothetical protein